MANDFEHYDGGDPMEQVGTLSCEIVSGTNKNGKSYQAVQFSIMTERGVYKSGLCFPSPLEKQLVIDAIQGR